MTDEFTPIEDTAAANDAAAAVVTPKITAADLAIVQAGGYRPKPRTRFVVADPTLYPRLTPWEDAPPFWAEIDDTLTFEQMKRIPTATNTTYQAQQEVMAPWVINWNAWAFNEDTGLWQEAPPPATAGWQIFESQTKYVTSFLVTCLRWGGGTDLPKSRSRSGSTDSGNDESNLG